MNERRCWRPSDPKERKRTVEIVGLVYRERLLVGAVVKETDRHLNGVALAHLLELGKVVGDE